MLKRRSAAALFKNAEFWYVTTTDRGSNEVAARGITQSFIATKLGLTPVFYANSDCFEHLAHLITLSSMKLVDEELAAADLRKWRYYSSLAVFTNTVRGLGKKVFQEWATQHGASSAASRVMKLFPRCSAGRWLSTNETEQRILACGQELFQPVLNRVLQKAIKDDKLGSADVTVWSLDDAENSAEAVQDTPPQVQMTKKAKMAGVPASGSAKAKAKVKPKGKARGPSSSALHLVNELSMQETQAYSEKVGKYRRSTLSCVGDDLWWFVMEVMNHAKQPTVHLSAFLKKQHSQEHVRKHGNTLTQLVHHMAEQLMQEFEQVLDNQELATALCRAAQQLPDVETNLG